MAHFTDEDFRKIGRTREQCIEVISMNGGRIENFRNLDELHERIHGYKYSHKENEERQQLEQILVSHRYANKHQKWYRLLKTILRSTGLTKLNNTMAKLMMESNKRKNERTVDANGATRITPTKITFDPPAIFPIYKYVINEAVVGTKTDNVSFTIFYDGIDLEHLSPQPIIKYQITIQNVYYRRKNDRQGFFKTIPYAEKELTHGLMYSVEFKDIPESQTIYVLFKVDVVFVPREIYTDITKEVDITLKKEEPESDKEKKFVGELNEKSKKLSKASQPAGSYLPRLK